MTTATNAAVVVEVTGLVRVCAFCVPRLTLDALHATHRCTDSICAPCLTAKFAEMDAAR